MDRNQVTYRRNEHAKNFLTLDMLYIAQKVDILT